MPLRRSLAALAFSLCALGVTGCENGSFEFKGPSISFSQNYIDEGIQKFNAGDYEGALLVFNEMIEKFPEDPQGYINKGGSLINLNRLPEALEATNKAIELGTKDPIAYSNHATILFTLSESPESLKEALKSINRSIELNPEGCRCIQSPWRC
jgi:Flp pilus assembly protein TadD